MSYTYLLINLTSIDNHTDREELLLQDCEWKIRSTQKSCKERIVEAEKLKTDALKNAARIEAEAQTQFDRVYFKIYFSFR